MIHDQISEKKVLTVMVNNSTYNHLSPHTIKKPQRKSLEIQVLAWDRYINVAGLK
jgi:hypothetical protein